LVKVCHTNGRIFCGFHGDSFKFLVLPGLGGVLQYNQAIAEKNRLLLHTIFISIN
jgi:hypothetical protein